MSQKFTGIHEQQFFSETNPPTNYGSYADGVMAERQRIVNMFMTMHESNKSSHNYWHVAANLVQAEVASDT